MPLPSAHSHLARCLREDRELEHQSPADADALREQAVAEARRAALLQDANATLQRLGSLGREITAQFDLDQVLEHLYRQLQGLLDLQHLSIWLRAEDGGDLQLRFGLEHGVSLATLSVALDDDASPVALCVRQAQELLYAAVAQSAKVNRLAAELGELAQLESGAMQPALARFSLAQMLFDVVRKLELAVKERSQRVRLYLPRELPDALADAGMIERVLTNLLDNAIQHTPQGSEIRVEISADVGSENGQLLVTVLDTGPGIPTEWHGSLFSRPSPVARAHRPGGSGMGLVIVQRLLQQHGREIHLVQRAGYGAAFSFGVPCVLPQR